MLETQKKLIVTKIMFTSVTERTVNSVYTFANIPT
jgi:hypothetical protein